MTRRHLATALAWALTAALAFAGTGGGGDAPSDPEPTDPAPTSSQYQLGLTNGSFADAYYEVYRCSVPSPGVYTSLVGMASTSSGSYKSSYLAHNVRLYADGYLVARSPDVEQRVSGASETNFITSLAPISVSYGVSCPKALVTTCGRAGGTRASRSTATATPSTPPTPSTDEPRPPPRSSPPRRHRRRGGGRPARPLARRRRGLAAALVAASAGAGGHGSAAASARGLRSARPRRPRQPGRAGPGGALTLALTLTDGPLDPLPVRPLVFVDGVLRADDGVLELPCGREVVWSTPPTGARHAVHWTVMPWPPVPPALAALTPRRGADALRRSRAAGAVPVGRRGAAAAGGGGAPPPTPIPSRPGRRRPGRRATTASTCSGPTATPSPRAGSGARGAAVGFRLRYLAGELGAGPLLATCLLDGRQLDAFAGRAVVAATAAAGHLLEIDGVVVVPGPGWHRLHCLLLPDVAGERPATWPRPLLAAYLWGEP
jgi:hypothetical protein